MLVVKFEYNWRKGKDVEIISRLKWWHSMTTTHFLKVQEQLSTYHQQARITAKTYGHIPTEKTRTGIISRLEL